MNASDVIDAYRRALGEDFETVTLRHWVGTDPATRFYIDQDGLPARIQNFRVTDLDGEVIQGDADLIVLADGVLAAPVKGDAAIFRGAMGTIDQVDDNTRRIGGTLIAYVIKARGVSAPAASGLFISTYDYSNPQNSGFLGGLA